jgi:nucleotide-binding universal stress UspA family protein
VIRPKTILVAADFSDSARTALEHGGDLALAFNASLHVLCVVTEPLHEVWAGYSPGAALIETVDHLRPAYRSALRNWCPKTKSPAAASLWLRRGATRVTKF